MRRSPAATAFTFFFLLRSPAERVRFGKDEQGSSDEETDNSNELSVFEQSVLSSDVAGSANFEDKAKTKSKPNEEGSIWKGGAREQKNKLRAQRSGSQFKRKKELT